MPSPPCIFDPPKPKPDDPKPPATGLIDDGF